jgi:hypothetical protein
MFRDMITLFFQVSVRLDRLEEDCNFLGIQNQKIGPMKKRVFVLSQLFFCMYGENILWLQIFSMSDYALRFIYSTLLSYKFLIGFLGWEYLFSRYQLITSNSTFKQFETISSCFKETAPNRFLRQ